MPADDIIVPKQNRITRRTLFLVAILLVALLGGGTWLFYKYSTDEFADILTDFSSWLDDPPESIYDVDDPIRLQARYEELHADLLAALNSEQSEKLRDFGRAKFREQIALGLTRAESAFNAGDVNDALRHLELSSEQWQQAIAEIDASLSESTNTQEVQVNFSDEQSGSSHDDSSVSELVSVQDIKNDEGNFTLAPNLPDEESIANVILSIPIGEQRTGGELAQSDVRTESGDQTSSGNTEQDGAADIEVSALIPQPVAETAEAIVRESKNLQADSASLSEKLSGLPTETNETRSVPTTASDNQTSGGGAELGVAPDIEVSELIQQPEAATAEITVIEPELPQVEIVDVDEHSSDLPTAASELALTLHEVDEDQTGNRNTEQDSISDDKASASKLQLVEEPVETTTNDVPKHSLNDAAGVIEQASVPSKGNIETETVLTATNEDQAIKKTTDQQSASGTDVPELISQPVAETAATEPKSPQADIADGNQQPLDSPIKVPEVGMAADTQVIDLDESSGTEVSALIPQTTFEVEDSISSESKRLPDPTPDNGSVAKLEYEIAISELNRIFPTLEQNKNLVPNNKNIIERVQQNLRKAKDAYRVQNFNDAKRLIDIALSDAMKAAEQEQEYYQLNLTAAKNAYENRNAEKASETIGRAIALRPNSHEAVYWQDQIEILPNLIQAQQDAESARKSGELQKEVDALERIVLYSTDADDAVQRIAELKQLISDREFASTIDQGRRALSDGNFEQAKRELARAKKQRPFSSETASLQKRIEQTERQDKISRFLAAAMQAWENDDWVNALVNYQRVLAIDPQNDEAVQGQDFAVRIIALQREIDEFLSKPHRLSTPNIAAAANSVADSAVTLGVFSPKLKSSANSLKDTIREWQTPVPVRVLSDGKTEIGIRGVGRIGKTKEKSIELRPGTYVFEGKREGYRSTLIEMVVVNTSDNPMEVTVICNERS